MVNIGINLCPACGGELIYYDKVLRIVRTKGRETTYILIKRVRCIKCRHLHRELPNFIHPFKQYEADVINGVLEGLITSETLGFEDYPCESTMKKWLSQNLQLLL